LSGSAIGLHPDIAASMANRAARRTISRIAGMRRKNHSPATKIVHLDAGLADWKGSRPYPTTGCGEWGVAKQLVGMTTLLMTGNTIGQDG
jgi:hypothetical protein